jgi:hypothetical protein
MQPSLCKPVLLLLLAGACVLSTLVPAESSAAAGEAKAVVYFWRGRGTGSFLPNKDYQRFVSAIFPGHEVVFDNQPERKARVLEMLARADIAYVNAHAGYLPAAGDNPPEHFLWAGAKDTADYALTALNLAEARRKPGARLPALVVLGACETLAPPPAKAKVLQLPAGFGLTADTRGRALIGFREPIEGYKCDGFFRVFFAKWAAKRADGTYPTLEEARAAARDFLDSYTKKFGNNDKLYMNRTHLKAGEDMVILGDASLRFSDVLRARAKRDE